MDACDYLAGMYLDGIGGPSDGQMAAVLYDRACAAQVSSSCVHLAWMGRSDGGGEPLAWLERACQLDERACVVLGEVNEGGLFEGAELSRAADAFARGCAVDDPDACFRLASLYQRGVGVAKDEGVAARMFGVSCSAGHAAACAALARAYADGRGVSRSLAEAAHFRGRACALGARSECEAVKSRRAAGPGRHAK